MSSVKRFRSSICQTSDSKNMQSFDERICDDLCEEILQYLPLEYQLILEGVSKQFQRTVYNKQNSLYFDHKLLNNFNFFTFESFLKKFSNIRRIYFANNGIQWHQIPDSESVESDQKYSETIIDLIVKHCHKLNRLNTHSFVCENSWNKLLENINPNVFTLDLDPNYEKKSIKYCLESLAFVKELHLKSISNNKPYLSLTDVMSLTNLRSVLFEFNPKDFNNLQTFIENNKRLKSIDITAYNCDSNQLNYLFNEISKLNDLIELNFVSLIGLNDKRLTQSLKQIALNCPKLSKIECILHIHSKSASTFTDAISSLKVFKSLKGLKVRFMPMVANVKNFFSFNAFEGFEKLVYLGVETHFLISEAMLKDIGVFLPKLKLFRLRSGICGTELVADYLSRLSCLQLINIFVESDSMKQQIKESIVKNCPQIRNILINVMSENDRNIFSIYSAD